MKKSKWLSMVGMVSVLSIALAGCAPAGDDAGAPAEETGPFVIAADAVTTTLEPGSYDGIAHRYAFDPLKGPLVRYINTEETANGTLATPEELEPWLAESWEILEDGIEFTLRDDVVSPYGNPLTPEDVVYTLERAYAAESNIAKSMLGIAGVDPENPAEVTGENTVKINATVNYLSLFVFETYWLAPLDSVEVEKHVTPEDPYAKEWLATNNAMFGAYTVGDDAGLFTPGEEIRLVKNPNYTRESVNFEEVIIRAVPEVAGRIALVQSGEADQAIGISYENLSALQSDDSLTFVEFTSGSQDVLVLNNTVFTDPRVRQAISHAIDREALLESAYQGFGNPSTSIMSTAIPAENSTAPSFEHDPERARELLEEAGATGLSFTIHANPAEGSANPDTLLTALQQQLAEAGITVDIQVVASNADFRAGYAGGAYEAFIRGEGPLASDPVYLLNLYYIEGAASNFGFINVPELNDAVSAARPLLTGAERNATTAPGLEAANELQVAAPLVETVTIYTYAPGICPPPLNRSFPWYPAQASTC